MAKLVPPFVIEAVLADTVGSAAVPPIVIVFVLPEVTVSTPRPSVGNVKVVSVCPVT